MAAPLKATRLAAQFGCEVRDIGDEPIFSVRNFADCSASRINDPKRSLSRQMFVCNLEDVAQAFDSRGARHQPFAGDIKGCASNIVNDGNAAWYSDWPTAPPAHASCVVNFTAIAT